MSTTTSSRTRDLRPTPARTAPPLHQEPGVRFALLHAVRVVVVLLGVALGVPHGPLLALAAVAVLGPASRLGLPAAAGLALSTWAVWTGFVAHSLGRLTLAPGDLERLGLVLGAAVVLAYAAPGPGRGRHRRRVRRTSVTLGG